MSQFPIENLNVNQGDSVFENLYITDRFFYDFSEDNIKSKKFGFRWILIRGINSNIFIKCKYFWNIECF